MKKFLFKMTLMILVMLGFSNYMMYIMTGQSPLNFSLPKLSSATEAVKAPSLDKLLPEGTEKAFKWKDENGVVHYASEAPPEGQTAELINVDPNTNLIQGIKAVKEQALPKTVAPQAQMPSGNIYKPQTIQKLIDDAHNVQETLNKRYEDLENR